MSSFLYNLPALSDTPCLRIFVPENIDDQLTAAAISYCNQTLKQKDSEVISLPVLPMSVQYSRIRVAPEKLLQLMLRCRSRFKT